MIINHRILAVAMLSGALFAAFSARAETPAAPAPDQPVSQVETMPMPMMGMGMMHGRAPGMEPCKTQMGMGGGQKPCMGGGKCKMADGLEHRIEALEKRLDAMQLSLELMARQGGR